MTRTFYARTFGDLGPRKTIHSFESKKSRDEFVDKTASATAIPATDAVGPWGGQPTPHHIHHGKPDQLGP